MHSVSPSIMNSLRTNYDIETATLTSVPGGADNNASVYKAQTAKDSSFFVKLKRGQQDDISATLLTLLQEAGIAQIIPPVKTLQGQPNLSMDGSTLTVYPFVEGKDGFSSDLTQKQWVVLGTVLRQVHEFKVPSAFQTHIRRDEYSPKWREAVRALYTQIETALSVDEVSFKLIKVLKERREQILQLVDRAERLSQKIQKLSPNFVLCHSDIHGGNVLLDGKESIYIIDWDEPILAPKERDLMFIGGGVGNVWNLPHEEEFFYQGYGKTEINQEIMAYYRFERIVEDIAQFGAELLSNKDASKDRSVMFKQFIDMFMPRGVVDIAFETENH